MRVVSTLSPLACAVVPYATSSLFLPPAKSELWASAWISGEPVEDITVQDLSQNGVILLRGGVRLQLGVGINYSCGFCVTKTWVMGLVVFYSTLRIELLAYASFSLILFGAYSGRGLGEPLLVILVSYTPLAWQLVEPS